VDAMDGFAINPILYLYTHIHTTQHMEPLLHCLTIYNLVFQYSLPLLCALATSLLTILLSRKKPRPSWSTPRLRPPSPRPRPTSRVPMSAAPASGRSLVWSISSATSGRIQKRSRSSAPNAPVASPVVTCFSATSKSCIKPPPRPLVPVTAGRAQVGRPQAPAAPGRIASRGPVLPLLLLASPRPPI